MLPIYCIIGGSFMIGFATLVVSYVFAILMTIPTSFVLGPGTGWLSQLLYSFGPS